MTKEPKSPEEKMVDISVTLFPSTIEMLDAFATEEGLSRSAAVRLLVAEHIRRRRAARDG